MWISLLSATLSGNRASNRDVKRRSVKAKARSRADPSNSDLGKEVRATPREGNFRMCSTVRQVQEPTSGSVTLAEIGPKGLGGKPPGTE